MNRSCGCVRGRPPLELKGGGRVKEALEALQRFLQLKLLLRGPSEPRRGRISRLHAILRFTSAPRSKDREARGPSGPFRGCWAQKRAFVGCAGL